MLSDTALAEAARYCDNDLAIVLGERLSEMLDVEDQLEALRNELQELNRRCDTLTDELTALENDQ
jgi:predicted  nucleic acid-binding Zn-ribbon protein